MNNYSKNRKWEKYGKKNNYSSDIFFIYNLTKKNRGKYLNTWFDGIKMYSKEGYIYRDEIITLKKVDKETASCLYNRFYNSIEISIMCPTGAKFKFIDNKPLYNMKAQIHSIDDSSYGIWWENKNKEYMSNIRFKIMEWINKHSTINGEDFLNYCIEEGADIESKDYN